MKRSLVLTEYWSGDHRPYVSMLRDGETDADLGYIGPEVLRELVTESGAVDGDEVDRHGNPGRVPKPSRALAPAGEARLRQREIVVRRTGRRPFGDRRVRLVAPHTYEREE